MKCPTDDTTLQISERQGIEIDYCPTCRGVWLDRGELDKIVERAAEPFREVDHRGRGDRVSGDRYDDGGGRKRKRGGFLGDLFELGG